MPGTDIRLGRRRDRKHEHRPGLDISFSAPKSVSLAALLPTEKHPRGDRSVLRCHDEAVRAARDWIEETILEMPGWNPGEPPAQLPAGVRLLAYMHYGIMDETARGVPLVTIRLHPCLSWSP